MPQQAKRCFGQRLLEPALMTFPQLRFSCLKINQPPCHRRRCTIEGHEFFYL
jgi:hypothetical protein